MDSSKGVSVFLCVRICRVRDEGFCQASPIPTGVNSVKVI
jgi:hypothetical protein